MSTTTDGITIVSRAEHDLGRVIRAVTSHADKSIQCYLSGRLVASQRPTGGVVEFVLAEPADEDIVFLLAVDPADADVDFWADTFIQAADRGNRILVETPRTIGAYGPGDRWQVYLGQAGQAQATVLVCNHAVYPGGRRSGGWGSGWGLGGWGFGGADCAGWGHNWGIGEYGFDCEMLWWLSDPLGPGTYPITVLITDACGNTSGEYTDTMSLETYPRPASAPSVSAYDHDTDTLTLTFESSPDAGA